VYRRHRAAVEVVSCTNLLGRSRASRQALKQARVSGELLKGTVCCEATRNRMPKERVRLTAAKVISVLS